MSVFRFIRPNAIATSVLLSVFGLSVAHAGQIIASATGISSPMETIDFTEIVLAGNTVVTTQYSSLGITLSPGLYYDAETTYFPNEVSNFSTPTQPAFVNPAIISFSSPQTSAAFEMVADNTQYLFQAFLGGTGGTLVDSFISSVGFPQTLYYGFTNETFDTIEITQDGTNNGPYWDLTNIELSNASISSGVPEPASMLLVCPVLAGLWFASRRRSARQAR